MALFKRLYYKKDPATGRKKKCRTEKWYGQYRDLAGNVHRVPLATDKVAAAQMLADLVKQSERGCSTKRGKATPIFTPCGTRSSPEPSTAA
jgi:hypothetical protein